MRKLCRDTLEKLIAAIRDVVAYFEELDHSLRPVSQREIALLALELRELYESLDVIFFTNKENQVYSVRLNRAKDQMKDAFMAQPLNVGQNLNEAFYSETDTVVYTSATLSVDNSFESFVQAMGLNEGEASRAETLQIESTYDFDINMRVYLPSDMPEPQRPPRIFLRFPSSLRACILLREARCSRSSQIEKRWKNALTWRIRRSKPQDCAWCVRNGEYPSKACAMIS